MIRILGVFLAALLAQSATACSQELKVIQNPWYNLQSFHQSYLQKHAFGPNILSIENEDELLELLLSGVEFDLARTCSSSLEVLLNANLLRPWDKALIDAYESIDPRFLYPDNEDNIFLLPYEFGSNIVVFDPESVPDQDVATLEIFQNASYQNLLSIPDDIASIAALAFLSTNVTDWAHVTAAQVEEALEWWRRSHGNVRYYWDDEDTLTQAFATGNISAAYATQEIVGLLRDYDQPVDAKLSTREGATLWSCGLVISAKSRASPELIYDFANAHFEEPAVRQLHEWRTVSTNLAASLELLEGEPLTSLGIPPDAEAILMQSPLPLSVRESFVKERKRIGAMP